MMLDAAMRLMQDGQVPSISDVAEEAQVSRATAYRYFPTQSVLIQAAVDEALGPILKWGSTSDNAEERVSELIRFSYPRMDVAEARPRVPSFYALELPRAIEGGLPELDEFEDRARSERARCEFASTRYRALPTAP